MKAEKQLPMKDLKLFGIYRNGKFTIPEEQVMALKNGKMTDVVELSDLKTRDVHIEKLPARLSIVKGENGMPSLRIDPVYIEANNHPLLTDEEKTRLMRNEIANLKKDFLDKEGKVQKRVIEYDSCTKQFFSVNPDKVKSPVAVNGEILTPQKKRKFQEGEMIELADGTQLQFRSSDRRGLRSNRTGLVLSILIDGGISYMLITGVQRLVGKKSSVQQSYSAGYFDAVKEVQKEMHRRMQINPKDREAMRDFNLAKDELSRISSRDKIMPREDKKHSGADSVDIGKNADHHEESGRKRI